MRMKSLAVLVSLLLCLGAFGAEKNLVLNPGFEQTKGKEPANWTPLTIGPAAQFQLDREVHHAGGQSLRITAPEITRVYICSDYIPVAPGETIDASAWVKCKDVPEAKGAVIIIGDFADANEKSPTFVKFGTAKVSDGGWQQIKGQQKVPEGATRLRLRLGFSYSQGTLWWDDVNVHAQQPLVAAIALAGTDLSPGIGAIPIDILNRAEVHGQRQVRIELGSASRVQSVRLTGEPVQRVDVPVEMNQRGAQVLKVALSDDRGEKAIFSEERHVVIPPAITLMPISPTHWAIEDGNPKLEGEVRLAMSDAQRTGAALSVRLIDAQNQTKATWTSERARVLPDGFIPFQMSAPKLPLGDYKMDAEFAPRNGEPLTSDQPLGVINRAQAKTTINSDGYPVANGEVILPLGIFNGGKFKEQAEAGFTVTHAYNAVRVAPGVKADDQKAKDFLDQTYKYGMHMCCMVPLEYAYDGEWDAFRKRIRMFRNHPGLLCWDEEESLARGTTTMATLAKMRQIVQEEDPNHPFMVGDSRDAITRVKDRSNFFPLKYMDLGMWWWYPIPIEKRAGAALEGEEASTSDEMVPPVFLVKRNTDKPIWVGVQAYKKNEKSRYPNYTEYRAQAYIALMSGAKGLMWYGGGVTGGIFTDPKAAHWDDLKKVAHEMSEMAPIFMSPTGEAPKFTPASAPMSVMLKQAKEGNVLMVANRGGSPIEVTFDVGRSGSAKVSQEDRTVQIQDGKLRDKFGAYEVHVYLLPK
jgi:hypothetical protein